MEPYYPLHALVCDDCFLVQLQEYVTPEHIFTEYAYFSSYSTSWVEHARRYCEMIKARLNLGADSLVSSSPATTAICCSTSCRSACPCSASSRRPTSPRSPRRKTSRRSSSSSVSRSRRRLAAEGKQADLIIGNNVLAQVPDLNDFVAGMAHLLAPDGVITLEFPHLERLIDENQFDTIYHEHFSYFSLVTIDRLARRHGLKVFDVEEMPTHGGSLRVYLCRADAAHAVSPNVHGAAGARDERSASSDIDTYAQLRRARCIAPSASSCRS